MSSVGDGGHEAYTAIVWGELLSHERTMPQRPRPSKQPKATCAAPSSEAPSLGRGRRPHHARKEHVGTWEVSCLTGRSSFVRPASGRRGAEAGDARAREVRPCRSSDEACERSRAPGMERVERRAGAEGNANQQSTHRAQNRERVTQALGRGSLPPDLIRWERRKAKEEGTVHRASAPRQPRHVANGVLRAQAQRRP